MKIFFCLYFQLTNAETQKTHEEEETPVVISQTVIVNSQSLQSVLNAAVVCSKCKSGTLILGQQRREGWAQQLLLHCLECGFDHTFWSSPDIEGDGRRGKEINR